MVRPRRPTSSSSNLKEEKHTTTRRGSGHKAPALSLSRGNRHPVDLSKPRSLPRSGTPPPTHNNHSHPGLRYGGRTLYLCASGEPRLQHRTTRFPPHGGRRRAARWCAPVDLHSQSGRGCTRGFPRCYGQAHTTNGRYTCDRALHEHRGGPAREGGSTERAVAVRDEGPRGPHRSRPSRCPGTIYYFYDSTSQEVVSAWGPSCARLQRWKS